MERDRFAVEEPPWPVCTIVCVLCAIALLALAKVGMRSFGGAGALGGALMTGAVAILVTGVPALICAVAAFVRKERLAWLTIPAMLVFLWAIAPGR